MSNQPNQPIAIPNKAVLERIGEMIRQREQLDVLLTHTVRTAADLLGVPPDYQFDPRSGIFVPPSESSLEVAAALTERPSLESDSSESPASDASRPVTELGA